MNSVQVMSIEQVCNTLGCSRSRVFQLLRDGVLDRAPRYGAQLRIYSDSVDRALAKPPEPARKKRRTSGAPTPVTDADRVW